jgi:diguanylate cyclase
MGSTLTIVVLGIVLGIVQLAAGMIIGRCLPWGQDSDRAGSMDPVRLQRFARQLCQMAARVADDVDEHKLHMEQVNQELRTLAAGDGSALANVVLKTVGQVVQANQRLQSRLVAAEDKLQRQTRQIETHMAEARTDTLTGLPNRRAFDDEMRRRLAEWKRKRTSFCLVLLDVDHFKTFNDRFGHPAGDHVLQQLAEVFKGSIRAMDLVARVGGEEFAVVLPDTSGAEGCQATERIRQAVAARSIHYEKNEFQVTVSLGLALVHADDDYMRLIRRADEALYASKRAGRNSGHFHNGTSCVPILSDSRRPAAEPATHAPSASPGDSDPPRPLELTTSTKQAEADLLQVCNDLRIRLAEIAEET